MNESPKVPRYSKALHRLAVVLTIAVFPLIWVGGLVTTYDAGMAVPDWPGTYGWNMFAYPATTWLFGPFDLLVEHSHRLLGALAGFLCIGLVIIAWRVEYRRWFQFWTVALLAAVIIQGGLGGARVVLDERTIAMIHGCTGPLFFAMATATAVMSSRWWIELGQESRRETESTPRPINSKLVVLATLLAIAAYMQLIVGAQLRHLTGAVAPKLFTAFVHSHLTLAGLVLLLAVIVAALSWLGRFVPASVYRPSGLLALLVLVQIALGLGTWVVNYAVPWEAINQQIAHYTILAKGFWESLIVTAHVATGSLIISLSVVIALRTWRFASVGTSQAQNKDAIHAAASQA
ncbi:MAG TPA: cytochrome oxidase assembly protein [Planctomycetaceae bacterium]|nr:cytochrome oxidase assembly protein [Planctomycetaceae bacterium]